MLGQGWDKGCQVRNKVGWSWDIRAVKLEAYARRRESGAGSHA